MNLQDPEVINKQVMHPAEGTLVEVKGRLDVAVDPATLVIPPKPEVLSDEEIKAFVTEKKLKVVCATVGNDEHSVGMREIIDIKHGGLEKWGVGCEYLGTSVPVEKVLDAAIEHAAQCVLISTIITHGEIHRQNMEKLADLAVEKGVRDKLLLISGGTQVTDELARSWGMDAGFGRGTKGINVASFIVQDDARARHVTWHGLEPPTSDGGGRAERARRRRRPRRRDRLDDHRRLGLRRAARLSGGDARASSGRASPPRRSPTAT